jgi:O-antigen ligase
VAQVATGSGLVEAGKDHIQRAFGSDVHPVSFAIQMVAALVAREIMRAKRAAKFRAVHLALLAIGAVALYLTFARTAWVMAILTVGYVLIMRGTLARRAVTFALLAAISIGLFSLSDRFADLGSLPLFLANLSVQDVVFDWRYVDTRCPGAS